MTKGIHILTQEERDYLRLLQIFKYQRLMGWNIQVADTRYHLRMMERENPSLLQIVTHYDRGIE